MLAPREAFPDKPDELLDEEELLEDELLEELLLDELLLDELLLVELLLDELLLEEGSSSPPPHATRAALSKPIIAILCIKVPRSLPQLAFDIGAMVKKSHFYNRDAVSKLFLCWRDSC